jgi:predicted lactoylglutathione lyase
MSPTGGAPEAPAGPMTRAEDKHMSRMIFVNLPVSDLDATTRFYEGIGCVKNQQFSDEKAVSMVWSDTIYFMLLKQDFFATFTPRPVADARGASEVLVALSLENREAVDAFVDAAWSSGGRVDIRPAQELGFMYSRSVEDPDGHIFEAFWMDPSAVEGAAGAETVHA